MEDGPKLENSGEAEVIENQPVSDDLTQEPSQELVQEMAEELAQEPAQEPVAEPVQAVAELEQEPEQELPQEQMQELVQEIAQEPVKTMVQEPSPEPVQESAEVIVPTVEQESTQEEKQAAGKKRSRGGLIVLVAVLFFILGSVVTLLVLQLLGMIQLQNLFGGDSGKGGEASGGSAVVEEKQEDIVAKENIKKVAAALKQYATEHSGELPGIKVIEDAQCLNAGGKVIACEEFQFPSEVGVGSGSEVKDFYRDYLGQIMQMDDKVALNFYADLSAESEKEHYSGWSQANIKVFYNAFCQSEKKVLQSTSGFAVVVADDAEKSYFCAD